MQAQQGWAVLQKGELQMEPRHWQANSAKRPHHPHTTTAHARELEAHDDAVVEAEALAAGIAAGGAHATTAPEGAEDR